MTEFYKTGIGQVYYGKHVPELIKELRRVADSLERGNKLFEKELTLEKKKTNKEKVDDIKETEKLDKSDKPLNINSNVHVEKDDDLSAIDD